MTARRAPSRAAWGVVAVVLLLHLLPRPGYGFHRDELLYLAMGDHLDLFGMQFPPMIALLARVARSLPLPAETAVHLLPALALAGIMALAIAITRRLGGGATAEVLAALALAVAPLFMRSGALFQPVVFEQLWWTAATLALVTLLAGGDRRWWLVLGIAMGLAGLTKFSAAIFGIGVAAAVLFSPLRRELGTRWPWLAALVGALLSLPSVAGQVRNGWPFLDQIDALRGSQLERVTPAEFVLGQAFLAGAATLLLIGGILGLLATRQLRPWRPMTLLALAPFVLLLAARGKDYYLGPVHPLLYAAGAVILGDWAATRPVGRRLLYAGLAAGGVILLPLGVPLLAPPAMARYSAGLGVTRATMTNRGETLPLPQDYADMTGWREQVATVAAVFEALSPEERSRTVIIGGNYGRAGALAAYHREFDLPYPASIHGDFHGWGPQLDDPSVVIVVGGTVEELSSFFGEAREAARSTNPWGVEEERDVPVHVCRHPREPLGRLWPRLGPVWG